MPSHPGKVTIVFVLAMQTCFPALLQKKLVAFLKGGSVLQPKASLSGTATLAAGQTFMVASGEAIGVKETQAEVIPDSLLRLQVFRA